MKKLFTTATKLAILVTRKWLKLLLTLNNKFDPGFDPKTHLSNIIRSTKRHNMKDDKDEQYYTEQYWQKIQPVLNKYITNLNPNILDLGCGQGRLTIPAAKWCAQHNEGQVTGVDISAHAITQAKHASLSLTNVGYINQDILSYLQQLPDKSIDSVLFLEVSFFLPKLNETLDQIDRVLKKEGLLLAAFRPQYFNILYSIQEGLLDSTKMLLENRSGQLWGTSTYFNWNTADEIRQEFENKRDYNIIELFGIGSCSGIAGDPLAKLAQPSKLNADERQQLMELELNIGNLMPDAGRYMLLSALKS